MAVINSSTLINCTPAEAFDYLVDIRNELEWNPDAVSMVKLTDGPVRQGTRFLAKWKSSTQIEVECVEFDRPRRWVHRNGGRVTVTLTSRLEPEGNQTRLMVAFDARPRGWFRLVFPLFYLMMKRQEKANMVNCRAALERRLAAARTDCRRT